MQTLVTGGAGFIGSHLVDLLLARGDEVAVVDNLATGKRANLAAGATFHEIDLRSAALPEVVAEIRPEVVFHQAAQLSVKFSTEDPRYDADVNVGGL
ncbi:MAG TPA: NAD-dependent epimerase/dehydratase family protein, partial [Chloroflexota bacterium]|nr:NAD-dependent epimerase/dehydratase family protein [Chloroflexota bacterium]